MPSHEPYLTTLRWALLRLLRHNSKPHAIDAFVRTSLPRDLADEYRRAVTSLVASSWLAFGLPELLDGVGVLFRMVLCWLSLDAVLERAVMVGMEGKGFGFGEVGWLVGLVHLWLMGERWLMDGT